MRRTGRYYTPEVDETGKVVAVYALRAEAQDKKTWPKVMENVRTTRMVMGENSNPAGRAKSEARTVNERRPAHGIRR